MIILLLIMVGSVVCEDYFRPLYTYDMPLIDANDINIKNSFLDREKKVETLISDKCDNSGCKVNTEFLMTGLTDKSFGLTLVIDKMGLINKTIEVYTSDVTFEIETSYMYTNVYCKPFYYWAFRNYDEESYNKCVNGMDLTLVSASGEKDGYNWETAESQVYKKTMSPLSSDAVKCNHYWLTSLDMCLRKSLECMNTGNMMAFKISEDVTYEMSLIIEYDNQKYPINFKPDFNTPLSIEISENLVAEVQPSGSILNPISGYLICYNLPETKNNNSCDGGWFYAEDIPNKGNIPAEGFGRFQVVSIKRFGDVLYDKNVLKWDGSLISCEENKFEKILHTKRNKNIKNRQMDYDTELAEIFQSETSISRKVSVNDSVSRLMYNGLDDSCCVYMTGPSSNYLYGLTKNYVLFDDRMRPYIPDLPGKIVVDPKGVPIMRSLKFKKLMRVPFNIILKAKDMYLSYSKEVGNIYDLKIKKMNYIVSGAGSYFEYEFRYNGIPNNIKVESKDIVLLSNEIYVSNTGMITGTIGFKTTSGIAVKPTVCFGGSSNCVKPIVYNIIDPPSGSADDPDSSYSPKILDVVHSLIYYLYQDILYLCTVILIWIMNIFLILVMLIVFYKIMNKTIFRIIAILCVSKNARAIIGTNEDSALNVDTKIGTLYENEPVQFNILYGQEDYTDKYLDGAFMVKVTTSEITGPLEQVYNGAINEMPIICLGKGVTICFEGFNRLGEKNYKYALLDKNLPKSLKNWTYSIISNPKSTIIDLFKKGIAKAVGYTRWKGGPTTVNAIRIDADEFPHYKQIFYVLPIRVSPPMSLEILEVNPQKTGNLVNSIEILFATINRNELIPIKEALKKKIGGNCNYELAIYGVELKTTIAKMSALLYTNQKCNIAINGVTYYLNSVRKADPSTLDSSVRLGYLYNKEAEMAKWNFSRNELLEFSNMFIDGHSMKMNAWPNDDKEPGVLNVRYTGMIVKDSIQSIHEGGPINLVCTYMGDIDRCISEEERYVAYIKSKITKENKMGVKLRKAKYKGYEIIYTDRVYKVSIYPNNVECKGHMSVDKTNHLICMNDCCLYTLGTWLDFSIIKSDKKALMSSQTHNIKHYVDGKSNLYALREAKPCQINSFGSAYSCIENKYPWFHFLTFYIVPCSLTILIGLFLVINITLTIMQCCKGKRMDVRRGKLYGRLNRMTNNILSIKEQESAKLDDMEAMIELGQRRVVSRSRGSNFARRMLSRVGGTVKLE